MDTQESFVWSRQPEAESLLNRFLEWYCKANPQIQKLKEDLLQQTSSHLFDWVDHYVVSTDEGLKENGFVLEDQAFRHPGAQLPSVVVNESVQGVAVSVESIADFLMVRGIQRKIDGSPMSGYRRCLISDEGGIALWIVERRGSRTLEPISNDPSYLEKYVSWLEKWQSWPRSSQDIDQASQLAKAMADELGKDLAAWIILSGERLFWQAKNRAGQIQKNRQDRLGMGWANHDHHTFRSSRERFQKLVHLFEILGFYCRERFYAGEEAGWGAQVMENTNCGLVLFLDVDLSPKELEIDFAHESLPPLKGLGTIGLWCALHGDSILSAGMHHLEAQFDFALLEKDLSAAGIGMMQPFSDFSYLKQAFTEGEMWAVSEQRIKKLLKEGVITLDQAAIFRKEGAVGSHLENLERKEGFKGFNQKNVSWIIKKTDPRSITLHGA